MRKILFTLMLVALCIPALAQKITLKSSMPKGEAIRLSIATSVQKLKSTRVMERLKSTM